MHIFKHFYQDILDNQIRKRKVIGGKGIKNYKNIGNLSRAKSSTNF